MTSLSSRLFYVVLMLIALSGIGIFPSSLNGQPKETWGILIAVAANAEIKGETLQNGANEGAATGNDDDGAGDGESGANSQTTLRNPPLGSSIKNCALDENSVVLITGAAGFLGSELALALRRAYGVRKLLLVDNLGIESENESAYVPPAPNSPSTDGSDAIYTKYSEETLSLFEFKRQRAFRVLQELTAPLVTATHNNADDRNIDEAESIRFYRSDIRPSIPEFFDFGEVPLLEGIFLSHPDITHVVHLADVPQNVNQAVPRAKDSIKTGRMEGVLEEFRLIQQRRKATEEAAADGTRSVTSEARLPHFVYASSFEVYDHISFAENPSSQQPNPPPFREDKPITTPSSLRGASKLIDEVMASAYHSTHEIFSVGLRFFPVYGPWATPGTEVFDLVEHLIALADINTNVAAEEHMAYEKDTRDYVYIDDAVDAILAAMQYRPEGVNPSPVIFNVGTGKGSTLKELRELMESHFPKLPVRDTRAMGAQGDHHPHRIATKSYASISRAESHLGFQPQISLSEGIAHTLTWHRDRAFPYGRGPTSQESFEQQGIDAAITNSLERARGEGGRCSPLDRECLRSAPVFPCASECRREERCTPSAWDDVAVLSKIVTTGCDAVLYTIALDDEIEKIPSATTSVSTDSLPFVGAGLPADVGKKTQVRCNIAFVSETSPLVQRLKSEGEDYIEEGESSMPPLLRHGFWTVLPVKTPSSESKSWLHAFSGTFALEYLPKLSPGLFFGSSVRYAVYAHPALLFDNLPKLLKKMEDGPPAKNTSTALMLSEKRVVCDPSQRGSTCTWKSPGRNDSIQSTAYNMIRVALRGEILGGGLYPVVDSSFVIHALRVEDARLFRCDSYSETAQWGVSSDEKSLEFIASLHDLWSSAVSHWSGISPWWSAATTQGHEDIAGEESEDGGGEGDDEMESNEERRRLNSAQSNDFRLKTAGIHRRLSEPNEAKDKGTWMGVLSSTDTQLFTHILPANSVDVVLLDDYAQQ